VVHYFNLIYDFPKLPLNKFIKNLNTYVYKKKKKFPHISDNYNQFSKLL